MKKILQGLLLFTIILALELLMFLAVAALGQEVPKIKYLPQIVMTVDHQDGLRRCVAPKTTVFLYLTPVSGPTARAPLHPGDYLLCRGFMTEDASGQHPSFRCGDDVYTLTGIGFEQPKDR